MVNPKSGNVKIPLVKKSGGIQACLGLIDPLTNFGGITVKPISVCFLFGPMNPLIGNDGIVVIPGCVGSCFRPRSPLIGFGDIAIKTKESLVVLLRVPHSCLEYGMGVID